MRKFGIEVEYVGDNPSVISAIREGGLSSRDSMHSYMGHSNSEWIVKTDASVNHGGELVSPPLDFDNPEARQQVTTAVNALLGVGCRPDDSTGIHVHIDCSDLTVKQLVAVVKNFTKFEDVLYRIACSGWLNMRSGARTYARPLDRARAEAIAKARTMEEIQRGYYGGGTYERHSHHGDQSRYCGINLHSFFYRGTVEFRIFNSSMNAERVQAYIALCMALVQDARNGNSRSINKCYPLGGMRVGTTNQDNAFHRLLQVLRYEGDMSLEDMKRLTKVWKDSVPQPSSSRWGSVRREDHPELMTAVV
jgi:hypothetical protein